jgi:hypothetical protein
MEFYIDLIVKRSLSDKEPDRKTRIKSLIKPSIEQIEEWKTGSVKKFILPCTFSLMLIKLPKQDFQNFVFKCYKSIGKNIELNGEHENLYRIPTKQGAFFEEIDSLFLYSSEYGLNIAKIIIDK